MVNLAKKKKVQLIIDAKYYERNLQEQFGKVSIPTGNLYQIFTYVKTKENELSAVPHEKVAGMLLYASCKFIADEASSGSAAFYIGHFAVKGYIAEIILPIAFLLVMFHFIMGIFRPNTEKTSVSEEAAK